MQQQHAVRPDRRTEGLSRRSRQAHSLADIAVARADVGDYQGSERQHTSTPPCTPNQPEKHGQVAKPDLRLVIALPALTACVVAVV